MKSNYIMLTGNLGVQPQIGKTKNNKEFAKFFIITSQSYVDKETGEWKNTEPQGHSVIGWTPRMVEIAKSMDKGSKVIAEGKLAYSKWEDENGVNQTRAEIILDDINELIY